jgi:hypothetical protein
MSGSPPCTWPLLKVFAVFSRWSSEAGDPLKSITEGSARNLAADHFFKAIYAILLQEYGLGEESCRIAPS